MTEIIFTLHAVKVFADFLFFKMEIIILIKEIYILELNKKVKFFFI